MTLIEEVVRAYELATTKQIDPKRWSLDEAGFTCKKAIDSIQYEPTGALAVLLMTKAWEEYKRYTIHVHELIDNPQRAKYILDFEEFISKGEPSKLLASTLEVIERVTSKFNIDNVQTVFEDKEKFIDIFSEAYENIYQKYTIDRFSCENSFNNEPYISIYEYHFHCLQDFVNCLKRSENCIVYAKIDGLYDWDDCDQYDMFYAFGCRCGDKVYINSDRPYHAVPTSRKIKKSRNPAKELRNKAGFTWMPYYDLKNNHEVTTDNSLVVIDPNIVPKNTISESYDLEARMIIAITMSAMYQKYFVQKITNEIRYNHGAGKKIEVEDSWFDKEIKLLPTGSTALTVPGQISLPALTKGEVLINHPTLKCYDNDFYSYYLNKFIKEDELNGLVSVQEFLGTKLEAEQRVWWTYRNAALPIINERLIKSIAENYWDPSGLVRGEKIPFTLREPDDWSRVNKNNFYNTLPDATCLKDFDVVSRINNNLHNIMVDCFTTGDRQGRDIHWSGTNTKYYSGGFEIMGATGSSVKLYDKFDDDSFVADTLKRVMCTLKTGKQHYKHTLDYSLKYHANKVSHNGNLNCDVYYGYTTDTIHIIPCNDVKNRPYVFQYKVNTVWDLCYLLNCKKEELPEILRRFLSSRYSWKPYTGNSILDVTDPLDDVFDWVDDRFDLQINLYFSKTEIKEYCKILGIEPKLRDMSGDEEYDKEFS